MFVEEAIPYDYRVPEHRKRTVDDLDRATAREDRMVEIRKRRAAARATARKKEQR